MKRLRRSPLHVSTRDLGSAKPSGVSRSDRNRILHSAFIELKTGGEVQGLLRSNPKIQVDEETGEPLFDQELLTAESFSKEMKTMADVAVFLNRAYLQLIRRYPNEGACSSGNGG